ncbi:IFN protein, partial [Alopecoenas beccarii]|nr:IFN protein [Alopecoenas beccarii]
MAAPATPHPRLQHGTLALLLLLLALTTALACHHLCPHHATFPWDSLQLLQTMDPSPPQPCHHQHTPFPFSDTLLHTNHSQQAAATTLCILQHLFATLSSPRTLHHWDIQAQHQLLNQLQHHIRQLEQCVPANSMLFKGQGPCNLLLSIKKYFGHIQDFLCTHHHRPCTWDHNHLEACTCFQCLHNLTCIMC